jgi:hypothetical protein
MKNKKIGNNDMRILLIGVVLRWDLDWWNLNEIIKISTKLQKINKLE